MTRLAICGALVLISIAASACATKPVPGRYTQDVRDDIQRTAAYMNRDIVGGASAGPF